MTDPIEELDIIQPDIELEINGETVTVKEFTFFQGLRLGVVAKPLLDDLAEKVEVNNDFTLQILGEVFADHSSIVSELIAQSTGETCDWVELLSDAVGQHLLMTFWQVNSNFFVSRLLTRKMATVMPAAQVSAQGDSLVS